MRARRIRSHWRGDCRLGVPCGGGIVALLDTGAEICVIDYKTLQTVLQLTRQVISLTPTDIKPTSITGQEMQVVGKCALKLPGLPTTEFTVIKDLPVQAVLGADFFAQHDAAIYFKPRVLRVNKQKIKLVNFEGGSRNVTPSDNVIPDPSSSSVFALNADYKKLLDDFPEVFSDSDSRLGEAVGVQMNIKTTGPPIKQRAYRLPLVKRQAVAAEIERLLAEGIIRPSSSAWASPIVIVPKKTGGYRLCIDYRKLNSVTIKDSHPLPNIRDIFDNLQGSSHFSLLDLYQGYHHIPLDEESIPKTAFSCHLGHFEYVRMPFGLCNAPAVFQRLMNVVLHGLIGNGCFVYLDDICIYGKTKEEHDMTLKKVLERLRQYGLCTKASKCTFGTRTLKLLGHIVDEKGIHTDPEKCLAISKMPAPKSVCVLTPGCSTIL